MTVLEKTLDHVEAPTHCFCGTKIKYAGGIGPFCPNEKCQIGDGPWPLYRSGSCRNNPYALSHTYMETDDGLRPMCGYGWNRSDGERFSIFRGSYGTEGDCKLCRKNLRAGKLPVMNGWPHKTKWL